MECLDRALTGKRDWDPTYFSELFSQNFFDFNHLWASNMGDKDLIDAVETIEWYTPLVQDISLADETLYQAVEEIDYEYK